VYHGEKVLSSFINVSSLKQNESSTSMSYEKKAGKLDELMSKAHTGNISTLKFYFILN